MGTRDCQAWGSDSPVQYVSMFSFQGPGAKESSVFRLRLAKGFTVFSPNLTAAVLGGPGQIQVLWGLKLL